MKDIPDFDAIVTASSSFDPIQGYYPGTGPDGAGDPQEPDGPFTMLSPLLYAVDHGELPDYLLEAVSKAVDNNGAEGLDEALIKELQSLGYSQTEIDGLAMPQDEAPAGPASPATKSQEASSDSSPEPANSRPSLGLER